MRIQKNNRFRKLFAILLRETMVDANSPHYWPRKRRKKQPATLAGETRDRSKKTASVRSFFFFFFSFPLYTVHSTLTADTKAVASSASLASAAFPGSLDLHRSGGCCHRGGKRMMCFKVKIARYKRLKQWELVGGLKGRVPAYIILYFEIFFYLHGGCWTCVLKTVMRKLELERESLSFSHFMKLSFQIIVFLKNLCGLYFISLNYKKILKYSAF